MKLQAKYSSSTFVPERSAKINSEGGKPASGYGSKSFMEGAPFGGTNGERPVYPKKGKKK